MKRRPPQLTYAILELSLRCNLKCLHCASGSGRPREGELELSDWLEVVKDLDELGCQAVDLMGGEALLSPLLLPVGRALQQRDMPWGLLTNGWLLDREKAAALVEHGCRGIGVSLDGATAETHDGLRGRRGAFDRALAALDVLAGLDFKPRNRTALTSVSRRNIDELEAMGQLLAERLGRGRWQLNLCSAEAPRLPEGLRLDAEGIDRVAAFVDRARRRGTYGELIVTAAHDLGYYVAPELLDLHDHAWEGCPAGIHHLGLQSDGEVKGCLALDERFAVGNLRDLGLRQIWQGELLAQHRDFSVEQLGEQCADCVWGQRCRGGCTAYAVAHTGMAHDHPHCLWRRRAKAEQERTVCAPLPTATAPGPYLSHEDAAREEPQLEASADGDSYGLPLRSACIELTLRCNLTCLHCGSAAGDPRRAELDLSLFVDLFRDLHLLGCERVVLLGGEPLLHPDWEAIARMARGFDLNAALITNGLQVTGDVARRLADLGLTHVGVSVDGATDAVHDRIRGVPGARHKAWTAVDRLRDAGLPVTLITTLNRLNLDELPALRDQLAEHRGGGLIWQLQAANGTGDRFGRELMLDQAGLLWAARFIEQTRRDITAERLGLAAGHNIGHHACSVRDYGAAGSWRGCTGGIATVGICSDGAVKGCLSMSPCEIVGNINDTSLHDLWRAPGSFARSRAFAPGKLQGGCARCPHGSSCRAGCPEMARTATGDLWDNPLCLRQAELAERASS